MERRAAAQAKRRAKIKRAERKRAIKRAGLRRAKGAAKRKR
jgi:hypothetical protein